MATYLTSWKEIAQYVGKGVRTVQRWECQLGLPVHRPNDRAKGIVFAVAEELDVWMRAQTNGQQKGQRETEITDLQAKIIELQVENRILRSAMEDSLQPGNHPLGQRLDVVERCRLLIQEQSEIAKRETKISRRAFKKR